MGVRPMTYRELSAQALAENDYESFLTELERALTDGRRDPNAVVQETLTQIYYGNSVTRTEALPLAARVVLHTFDPRNVTTEPEYYTDIDAERYTSGNRSSGCGKCSTGHRSDRMRCWVIGFAGCWRRTSLQG